MQLDRARELLARAGAPVLVRIRADAVGSEYPVRGLLEQIEERLFLPRLEIRDLLARIRARASSTYPLFQEATGLTPSAYVEEARLETAVRLLSFDEAMPIEMLSGLVGYSSSESFRRALRRWCRCSPTALRDRLRAAVERGAELPDLSLLRRGELRRYRERELSGEEADVLASWLRSGYDLPVEEVKGEEVPAAVDRVAFEARWAGEWWQFLRELSPLECRRRLSAGYRFETPAIFEHLCRMSREEGRDDRQRGVEIARLALHSLMTLEGLLSEEELRSLEARGWAVLGNAYRLAFSYRDAEEAFKNAEELVSELSQSRPLRAELLYYRSCLRRYQHCFGEALQLVEEALELCRPGEALFAQLLLQRGYVHSHRRDPGLALGDYEAALEDSGLAEEPYLVWVAQHNRALAFWQLGRLQEAVDTLEQSRALAAELKRRIPVYQTLWLKGLIAEALGNHQRAATVLRAACEGFSELGNPGCFAVAALDLAGVEYTLQHFGETFICASKALAPLETLGLDDEGLKSLALLRRAIDQRQMSGAVLKRVRDLAAPLAGAPEVFAGQDSNPDPQNH